MVIRTEQVVPHQSRWTAGADFFERSKSTGLLRDSAAPTRWLGGDDAAGASSFRRSSQGISEFLRFAISLYAYQCAKAGQMDRRRSNSRETLGRPSNDTISSR